VGRTVLKAAAVGGAVLGALGVVALVGGKKRSAAPRVALIGDSYAVGLGPELAKLLPDFRYEGHVGVSTAGWLNRTPSYADWLPGFRPSLTLVSLGVNDGAAPNVADYQAIARALHGAGSAVVWVEPPAAVNAPAMRAAIASLGVPVVAAPNVPMAPDGLHPSSYGPWAAQVARAVS
jgi:lysophospholipase L1-like esterase